MYAGAATDSSSVTDPANYALVGPGDRRRHDPVGPVRPGHPDGPAHPSGPDRRSVHADRGRFDRQRQPGADAGAVRHQIHRRQRPVAVRQADLLRRPLRPGRRHGLLRRTIQNTASLNLLVPLVLILDPAQGFNGMPQNASQASDGSWLISLNGTRARRRRTAAGAEHDRANPDHQRPERARRSSTRPRSPARPPRPAPRSSTARP